MAQLVPLRAGDLEIGKPLRRPIYDREGQLLLAAGAMLPGGSQLQGLLLRGFCETPQHADAERVTADTAGAPGLPAEMGRPAGAGCQVSGAAAAAPGVAAANAPNAAADPADEMAEIRWRIGKVFHLQSLHTPELRCQTRLIGFVRDEAVSLALPMIDGKSMVLEEGGAFTLRALAGRHLYTFDATVLCISMRPYPCVHFSYPPAVRRLEVRKSSRAEVRIPAMLRLDDGGTYPARIIDLSAGGACLLMNHSPGPKGQTARLHCILKTAADLRELNLPVMLRSAAPTGASPEFKCGFQFTELGAAERELIADYLRQQLDPDGLG